MYLRICMIKKSKIIFILTTEYKILVINYELSNIY